MNRPNSSRHHYLPQFYLKHFADDRERLFIYRKENDRIFGPELVENYFWVRDMNTVEGDDSMETIYSQLEGRYSIILDELNQLIVDNQEIPSEILVELLIFANSIRWRNPRNIEEKMRLLEDPARRALYYTITKKETGKMAMMSELEELFSNPLFVRSHEIIYALPEEIFNNPEGFANIINHLEVFRLNPNGHKLACGDYPFIELESRPLSKLPKFIFPLSSNLFLAYITNKSIPFPMEVVVTALELKMIDDARTVIGCKDSDKLNFIVSTYKQLQNANFNFADNLRMMLRTSWLK